MMIDVQDLRRDSPILKTGIVYLDNTTSSLTPEPVLQKMLPFYPEYRANIERGAHHLSEGE
jgi:cysteine desulfurase/selenocysteine lyase